MKVPFAPALAAVSVLFVTACATGKDEYPSLARRDAERITTSPPADAATPQPVVVTPPNLELAARLDRLVDQARAAHGRFASRRPRAEQAVGGGASTGSERWAVATVALAELESARSEAMVALADLDELFAAERTANHDTAQIAAARDQVIAWIGEEDRVLEVLRRRL